MKKSELIKLLKKEGFEIKREGGNHEIWTKKGFPNIPVPRHKKEIPTGTAHSIIKTAGIKK